MILYFTGTGNSLAVARHIADATNENLLQSTFGMSDNAIPIEPTICVLSGPRMAAC